MKNWIALTLVVLTLAACKGKEEFYNSLTVTPTSLNFDAGEAGEKYGKTVAITTDAAEWSEIADATWITLKKKGNALTVEMSEVYIGTEPRQGTITITAGNAEPEFITVTQQAKQSLSASPTLVHFAAGETGNKYVEVTTNAADSWTVTKSTQDTWFSVGALPDGRMSVSVEALYYGSSAREAEVSISAGNAEKVIVTISQAVSSNTLTLSSSTVYMGYDMYGTESVYRVGITTDAPNGWEATETTSWFSIAAAQDGALVISLTESNNTRDSRQGTITVRAGNTSKSITVIQRGNVPSFDDIKYGSYSATGTPGFLDSPGPRSWSGTIRPIASGSYYELTNFGGRNITVRLTFNNGDIYMDGSYKAAENDSYNGYFRAYWEVGTNWTIMGSNYRHPVTYDKSTRTLTFGSYITTESSRPKALVGVVAYPKSGNTYGAFTDLYSDLKLRLTFSSSSAAEEPVAAGSDRQQVNPPVLQEMRNKD